MILWYKLRASTVITRSLVYTTKVVEAVMLSPNHDMLSCEPATPCVCQNLARARYPYATVVIRCNLGQTRAQEWGA